MQKVRLSGSLILSGDSLYGLGKGNAMVHGSNLVNHLQTALDLCMLILS